MRGVKDFSINKKNNKLLKFLVGAIALVFLLAVLNMFVSPVKNYFYNISSPIQKAFWAAGESSSVFLGSFLKAGFLVKENDGLKNEKQKLLAEVASLQSIVQGNKAQSEVSVSCQNSGFKLIMAGVIGLDDNDIVSINKGSSDGISEGMPVINQQNVLFGKVLMVYKDFSKIMLVSNKNSVVNVKIQQVYSVSDPASPDAQVPPEIDGVIKGSGGLGAYLDLIPISSEINSQDIVVTSAIDKSFPKDLLVAEIMQKQKNDQKPFQQAQVRLFFDVKAADYLFVITNYKQTN